jgi:hypothetical protein
VVVFELVIKSLVLGSIINNISLLLWIMTYNNLFNIVLKIIGLFFLKHTIELVPDFFQIVPYFSSAESLSIAIYGTVSLILLFAINYFFTYLFIFKSDWIIIKLRLTSGFDQEIIPLNIDTEIVLRISIIILGGLILADSIPAILRLIYEYYLSVKISAGMAKFDTTYFVFHGAKILIGLLLMGEQKRIVNYIERKSKIERGNKV